MLPFEERFGKIAVDLCRDLSVYAELSKGSAAWRIASALQKAHDEGYSDGHDDGSAPSSKDYGD